MEDEDVKRIAYLRTPFAKVQRQDPRHIVDAVMDPERRVLRVQKEIIASPNRKENES